MLILFPEHNILEFLTQHVNQALHEGFDDNVGRYPSYPSQNQFVVSAVSIFNVYLFFPGTYNTTKYFKNMFQSQS